MRPFFVLLLFIPFFANAYNSSGKNFYPEWQKAESLKEALKHPEDIRSLSMILPEDSLCSRIPELLNLEVLYYGESDMDFYHPMTAFPKEFCQLKKLQSISIVSCPHPLPDEMGNIKSLKYLSINRENDEFGAAYPTPSSISLLDSLEIFYGPLPPLPWPGTFSHLKKIDYEAWGFALPAMISKLHSLEDFSITLEECINRGHADSCFDLQLIDSLPNIRNLVIYGCPIKRSLLPSIFKHIDGLKKLEHITFDFATLRSKDEFRTAYESSALKNLRSVEFDQFIPDISFVVRSGFDSLKTLTVRKTYESRNYMPNPFGTVCVWTYPELMLQLPHLISLNISDEQNALEESQLLFKLGLRELANMQLGHSLDTLRLSTNFNDYFIYDELLDSLLRKNNGLKCLTLDGFVVYQLGKIDSAVSSLQELKTVYLRFITLDGKPFDVKHYSQPTRKNWFVMADPDLYDQMTDRYKYHDEVIWQLISSDLISYSGYELHCTDQLGYKRELPVDTRMIPEHHPLIIPVNVNGLNFPLPIIIYGSTTYYGYGHYDLTDFFIGDLEDYLHPCSDVLHDRRFHIDRSGFRKGKINYYDSIYDRNVSLSWFRDGHLRSLRYYTNNYDSQNTSISVEWNDSEIVQHYCYNTIPSEYYRVNAYCEIDSDTAGHPESFRTYFFGTLTEFRFNPDGTILCYGPICNWIPYGEWDFFDADGNEKMGVAPAALPHKKKKNEFVPDCNE